ncbi:hypothetical protein B0T22DRAFT_537420 [Podospora appendiculata]|uniref:Mitochondrial seryl-tRNA synthetase n=1 Tax=Podospora appendiculata TaxID=314037 RepID=A0AAE0X4Y1_9PEZI|nr:hypothetical protein B0T22DRAFT_537420 [Podospora appendiculata]
MRAPSNNLLSELQFLLLRRRPQPSSLHAGPRPDAQHSSTNGGGNGSNGKKNPLTRAERILSRLPPSLQKYTSRLRDAPVSHVVAFLILHEITAVVPLLGLFGVFHYTNFVPIGYTLEHYGGYVREGVGRFECYFTRKGWFGFGSADESAMPAGGDADSEDDTVLQRWESSDGKYKFVVEVALAYALTKVLLPLRILASVGATPWFAGVLVRLRNLASPKR